MNLCMLELSVRSRSSALWEQSHNENFYRSSRVRLSLSERIKYILILTILYRLSPQRVWRRKENSALSEARIFFSQIRQCSKIFYQGLKNLISKYLVLCYTKFSMIVPLHCQASCSEPKKDHSASRAIYSVGNVAQHSVIRQHVVANVREKEDRKP